jgi:hypothetical protein
MLRVLKDSPTFAAGAIWETRKGQKSGHGAARRTTRPVAHGVNVNVPDRKTGHAIAILTQGR